MEFKKPIFIALSCLLMAVGAGVSGQGLGVAKDSGGDNGSFNRISKEEFQILLTDIAATNPLVLERMANDPEMRRLQIENLKELLAFASQAKREGLASEPINRQELDNIRIEILATNYDKEINKGKSAMPPFGFITDKQVAEYWADSKPNVANGNRTHEAEFDDFLNAKLTLLSAGDAMKGLEISAEEKIQARDVFSRTRIYRAEFDRDAKAGKLTKPLIDKANLQIRLQQAQFLAGIYSKKIAGTTIATDDEVSKYIAANPNLDTTATKARAEKILARAKAGEDFLALANEYSEDPGNKGANSELQGGLYAEVPEGRMVPVFERAALALEPGQITPGLVESDFGYHIIKLEGKRTANDPSGKDTQIYDVRHILIATTYKDPDDPNSQEIPVKEYARNAIGTNKERLLFENLIKQNNIQVPDDFTVPVAAEDPTPNKVKKGPAKSKRTVTKRRH